MIAAKRYRQLLAWYRWGCSLKPDWSSTEARSKKTVYPPKRAPTPGIEVFFQGMARVSHDLNEKNRPSANRNPPRTVGTIA